MRRLVCVLAAAVTAAAVSGAADVEVRRDGTLVCAFGGGVTAGGLINYDNWGASAAPTYALTGPCDYALKSRGETFATGVWHTAVSAAGAVTVTNTFRLLRDVEAQACGTRVYLPHAFFAGGTWSADGGPARAFPAGDRRATLFAGKKVTRVTVAAGGEEITFAFPAPRAVSLSNDAAWCGKFSLRLQTAGAFAAGAEVTDVFTVTAAGRALTAGGAAAPVTVAAGAAWAPFRARRGVRAGSALDFSGWGTRDAPAGKHGWLRRVGGHFEFEGKPGVRAVFCGVNLVSSCCWMTHAETDALVTRLVRGGYNAVRLHHFECPGGITSGTGDASSTTLNPETMERMDYLVGECVKAGLYVTIDLHSYRRAAWRAMGVARDGEATFFEMKGMIHLTDGGFANWRAYVSNLLNHVNPYTGRAYKDEPALPLICLVNEGALTQGWNQIRELPAASAAWGGDARKIVTYKNPAFEKFCMDVEERSLDRMIAHVRGLGAKALLTDLNNGPHFPLKHAVRARRLDYFDNHFYVDHPQWLGARLKVPFVCRNTDVFDAEPGKFPADVAAAVRLPGMPYTVTEWNFSGPGEHRHQGGLYTGALAARGAWDGVWSFTFAHGRGRIFGDPAKDSIGSFDIVSDPVQLANERALVALYLRGDAAGADGGGLRMDAAARRFTIDTARTQGGCAAAGGTFRCGALAAALEGADAAVWATAVDGAAALGESARILVSHVTDIQNTRTLWADPERTVVLSRGTAPLLVRRGRARITLALPEGAWTVFALEEDGARRAAVPAERTAAGLSFTADTSRATFLYEVARGGEVRP